MDYYQTTERYKRRELRRQFGLVLWLILTGAMLWVGWFWGNIQQSALVSSSNQHIVNLSQQNERLEQELVILENKFSTEHELRVAAELSVDEDQQKTEIGRLKKIVAQHLSRGISEDQIRLALQSVGTPSRCRLLDEKELAVATALFAGKESSADLADGNIKVFIEGQARQQATKGRPWFDPEQDVSMRVVYLGGEKIVTSRLPLTADLIADSWLLRFNIAETPLNGYVHVKVSKCSLNQ